MLVVSWTLLLVFAKSVGRDRGVIELAGHHAPGRKGLGGNLAGTHGIEGAGQISLDLDLRLCRTSAEWSGRGLRRWDLSTSLAAKMVGGSDQELVLARDAFDRNWSGLKNWARAKHKLGTNLAASKLSMSIWRPKRHTSCWANVG